MTWPAAFGIAFPAHPGILILDTAPVETLARLITDMLAELPAGRIANGIFWWHRHDGWRQPVAGAKWEPYQPPDEVDQE